MSGYVLGIMRRCIFFLFILFAQLFWVSSGISQTDSATQYAVVGDTMLLTYGRINPDFYCGAIQYVGFGPIDSINFLAKWQLVSGGVNYWIYFIPHEEKKYDRKIHVCWVYATKQGCNYPAPGEDITFNCAGIADTIFHLTKSVIDDNLKIDTDKVIRYDLIKLPFRNNGGEQVTIDSMQYGGSDGAYYSVSLDLISYPKGIVSIPASGTSDSIKVNFTTMTPPDLNFSTIPILMFGLMGTKPFVDTVFLRTRSELLAVSLSPLVSQIHFKLPMGGHLDTTIVITHSKFLRFLDAIGATNGFETLSIKDEPPKTSMLLRCSTSDTTLQNMNVGLDFSYEEDFNSYALGYKHATVYVSYEFIKSDVKSLENKSDEFILFPNPSSGNVTLALRSPTNNEIQWLKIVDETGTIVFSKEHVKKTVEPLPFTINTSGYSKGIYLLLIGVNGTVVEKKFIIE